jgi:serine/threonine-protein phosphatase PGAM5
MISPRPFLSVIAVGTLFFTTILRGAGAEAGTGLHTLFLVRHGIYDPVPGADNKQANGLNPMGREQAALTGARLAALPVKIDAVITSEFTRARETGDIIAAKLGLSCQRDGLLNESLPAGADLDAQHLTPTAGAEEQFNAAWARYARPTPTASRNDVLVCHGNIIRWLVCKALGVDPKQWTRMVAANCAVTVIVIRPDGSARLLTYNDASHLPLDKQTWEMVDKPQWMMSGAAAPR